VVAGVNSSLTAALLCQGVHWIERIEIVTKHPGQVNRVAIVAGVLLGSLLMGVPWARADPAPERVRVVFLLAQFPDLAMETPRATFTAPAGRTGLVERLADYYAQVSAGRLRIDGTVASSIVTLPEPRPAYVQQPATMLRDAFAAFEQVSGEAASQAALENADAIVVFFAGPGKESDLRGGADDPWSNFTIVTPPLETPGGNRIRLGCVIASKQREELSSFGVLCHEFGHLLGLPELYAPYGASHEGIGVWGLMGQGTWLGRGDRPPYPSAWSRAAKDWTDVELVTDGGRVTLPAAHTSGRAIKIWARGPEHPHEYFLIENRQRDGFDRRLPGEGLLIWHVDERVTGYRTSQSDPDHMRVTLMQADGRDDLRAGHRGGGNRGDATDAWRGLDTRRQLALDGAIVAGVLLCVIAAVHGRRRGVGWLSGGALVCGIASLAVGFAVSRSPVFGPDTQPGSASWDGDPGRFSISRISAPGDPMSFTVRFHANDRQASADAKVD
jgi:M6 family metalloprotease-like protein